MMSTKSLVQSKLWKNENGFSLTELMVVIVIIGILALLAIPKFMSVVERAKMTEAKTMLSHVGALQEAYYYEHDRYGETLGSIGFEQNTLVTNGGNARYRISIEEASHRQFVVLATSVVDFDKDGQFNVWQITSEGQVNERTPD